MNTTSIPGFNAEASLYKTSGHYYMVGIPNALKGGRGVLPQLMKVPNPAGCPIGTEYDWDSGLCVMPGGGGSGCSTWDRIKCAGALVACSVTCATTGFAGCFGCLAGLGSGACIKCWSP